MYPSLNKLNENATEGLVHLAFQCPKNKYTKNTATLFQYSYLFKASYIRGTIYAASPFHGFPTWLLTRNTFREIAINYAKCGATTSQFPTLFRELLIVIPEIPKTRAARGAYVTVVLRAQVSELCLFFPLSRWISIRWVYHGNFIRRFLPSVMFQRRILIREHVVEKGLSGRLARNALRNCLRHWCARWGKKLNDKLGIRASNWRSWCENQTIFKIFSLNLTAQASSGKKKEQHKMNSISVYQ